MWEQEEVFTLKQKEQVLDVVRLDKKDLLVDKNCIHSKTL